MQRGQITLTKQEINTALNSVKSSGIQQNIVKAKLQAALDAEGESADVFFSEEEVEVLMDELSAGEQDESITGVRSKLQDFLLNLRSN